MPLDVSYPIKERGNTVPYPKLFDEIRRNHGFVDLRAKPELVNLIPEAGNSPALNDILVRFAQKNSSIMTLGCDLGEHSDMNTASAITCIAGGYVQICELPIRDDDSASLAKIAQEAELKLRDDVGDLHWEVEFCLCRTTFKLEAATEGYSLWIWFHAHDSTIDKAKISREKLLLALGSGLAKSLR
jgi:hypothetical protein